MLISAPILLIFVFIAATVPLVVTIISALLPSARTRTLDGYFLYDHNLDLDSFLKSSVGYSLQAASIYLLFLWGITYGIYAIIAPIAWGLGYYCIGRSLNQGKLDHFLEAQQSEETIHGHIWTHLKDNQGWLSKIAVLLITAATVIGLGGTLLVEVDYGSKFFLTAANLTDVVPSWLISFLIVAFTALYVLWGGYKAVVVTDRIQTPMAYGSFGLFTIGLCYFLGNTFGLLLSVFLCLVFASFLRSRLWILPTDSTHNKTVAWLTFLPLIIAAGFVALKLWVMGVTNTTIQTNFSDVFIPKDKAFLGFGIFGIFSVIAGNIIWQFIDLSSLQRLKSLKVTPSNKTDIARGMNATGWEVAGGWIVILCAAYALRALGVTDVMQVIPFLAKQTGSMSLLVPVFIFSVVIFVLSTISGFISAITFVAYYDLLKLAGLRKDEEDDHQVLTQHPLQSARLTSIFIMLLLYGLYQILIHILSKIGGSSSTDLISQAVYAIYAFQLAIAPTVFYVLFSKHLFITKQKLSALPVLVSTTVGLLVAWFSATASIPWFDLPLDSWYVIPLLLVLVSGFASFHVVHKLQNAYCK